MFRLTSIDANIEVVACYRYSSFRLFALLRVKWVAQTFLPDCRIVAASSVFRPITLLEDEIHGRVERKTRSVNGKIHVNPITLKVPPALVAAPTATHWRHRPSTGVGCWLFHYLYRLTSFSSYFFGHGDELTFLHYSYFIYFSNKFL